MFQKKIRNLVIGFIVFSFAVTSFGGVFASAVFAAESQVDQDESSVNNKDMMTGLLAVGLVALLASNGHKSDAKTSPAKAVTNDVPGSSTTPVKNPPAQVQGLTLDEQKAISLMNADRQAAGLNPLKVNMNLVHLAENYSQDMINRGFFAHNNPEGQSPFDRMNAAGISYVYAGENIAINNSVAGAESAFMNSPGHRANILNPTYTEVGIGIRYKSNGSLYVTQEFIGK